MKPSLSVESLPSFVAKLASYRERLGPYICRPGKRLPNHTLSHTTRPLCDFLRWHNMQTARRCVTSRCQIGCAHCNQTEVGKHMERRGQRLYKKIMRSLKYGPHEIWVSWKHVEATAFIPKQTSHSKKSKEWNWQQRDVPSEQRLNTAVLLSQPPAQLPYYEHVSSNVCYW